MWMCAWIDNNKERGKRGRKGAVGQTACTRTIYVCTWP